MPAWLASSGISALALAGFISAAGLPWTLKFMHGFFMDRYAYLAMGRRRACLIGAQFLIIIGLILCAVINSDVSQIALLSGFGFGIMLATTLQDVAVDGTPAVAATQFALYIWLYLIWAPVSAQQCWGRSKAWAVIKGYLMRLQSV
jgi:hypothetical protein